MASIEYDFKEPRAKGGYNVTPAYETKAVKLGTGSFARFSALQKDSNDVYTLYSSSSEQITGEAVSLTQELKQVTNETLQISSHAGTTIYQDISNLTVKSLDGSTTYTVNTDYTVDASSGTITLLETGSCYEATSLRVAYKWLKGYVFTLAKTVSSGLVVKSGSTTYQVDIDYVLAEDNQTVNVNRDSSMVSASGVTADYTHGTASGTPCAILLYDVDADAIRTQTVYTGGVFHSSYIPNYDSNVGAMSGFSFVTP